MSAASFLRIVSSWIATPNRRRRGNSFAAALPAEILEQRCLLSISNLTATVHGAEANDVSPVELQWDTASASEAAEYEVWIDQVVSVTARNAKVYYRAGLVDGGENVNHIIQQDLAPGTYQVWVRQRSVGHESVWVSHTFELDDDDNPLTPIQLTTPDRPQITVIRQGQGAAGQAISEGGLGWVGSSSLYEVWLGKRNENQTISLHARISNVPQNTITLRELALAANRSQPTSFSEVYAQDELAQLETGDYELFVRGVNGATSDNGQWVGRGPWSRGVQFSFQRIEGSDAVPDNLRVSSQTRLTAEWDPVPYAEAYLVSVWKGPDYSDHRPVNIQVQGTKFAATAGVITAGGVTVEIRPGDEVFVRVRAIGSEGMLEGLRAGNFASAVVKIPSLLAAADLGIPLIEGPDRQVVHSMPVLRWSHSDHASSYDVWFTSLQSGRRLFLATNITNNVFHVSPEALLSTSDFQPSGSEDFSSKGGLIDGRYRFWVRTRSDVATGSGTWSKSYDFTVDASRLTTVSVVDHSDPVLQPLVAPNLIERYVDNGQQNILITNGLGESFGASVLARFVPDEDLGLVRPVDTDVELGATRLRYPDLSVGNNVTDMAFLNDHHLIILSRGSSKVFTVDLQQWKVISEYSLIAGAGGTAPDVTDLEVLANGQVMIVANRSDRLRLLAVDANFQLSEVRVPGATANDEGFRLPHGRALQVSAVARQDGTFAVFLATPTVQGIVSASYDSNGLTLSAAVIDDGSRVSPISRSPSATPHLGGRTVFITDSDGESNTYYISTDRNGFLTWVNVETYEFGFIDLVPHIENTSRDPQSSAFKNPDDAQVDPVRLLPLDGNNIAVLNNRTNSVILQLESDDSGRLRVQNSSPLNKGYGAAVFTTQSGTKLYSTAGSGVDLDIGTDNVIVTDVVFDEVANTWETGEFHAYILADPVNRAVVASDDSIILDFHGARRATIAAGQTGQSDNRWVLELSDADGIFYQETSAPTATFYDAKTSQLYLTTRLTVKGQPNKHFVGVVEISNANAPVLHSTYEIESDLKWYFVEFTSDRIAVLDRLGSQVVTIADWQSVGQEKIGGAEFGVRHPGTFGEIRSGRIRSLADGTNVVLHDTAPDKVFAVFAPAKVGAADAVATVHTNTAGQWIFDVHVFDRDRVVAVTWDAKVLILNIRTGVFETIHQLDDQTDLELDLFGVRETAFRDGVLSVASPGRGVVAEFQIEPFESGVGHDVQLVSIVNAPDVVSTLLTASGQWVIEAHQVRHYRR